MRNTIWLSLYLISIFLAGLYAFKRPYYNWDMIAYMAVVVGYDHPDPNYVHDTVYDIAKQQIPGSTYRLLIDGGIEFRKRMVENSNEFYRQMPFYTVKPLYTRFIYLIYKTGVPLIQATVLPSLIGYLLIGILLIRWIKRYLKFPYAILFCLLTMLSAPMWDIARSSTPDCLSAFLVLSAMYFVLEIKSMTLTFIFLFFSILCRLDNVIPAVMIISLLAFSNKWEYKLSVKKYSMMLLLISITYLFITLSTRHFGWNILYYPTFLKSLNLSYTFQPQFHFSDYIALGISQIMTGLFFSHFLLFMVLALLSFTGKSTPTLRTLDFEQLFLCTVIAIMFIRFVLQPVSSDRFYIAYYLVILILLVKRFYHPVNIS